MKSLLCGITRKTSNAQPSTSNYNSCILSISHEVLLEWDASSHRFAVVCIAGVDQANQRDLLP